MVRKQFLPWFVLVLLLIFIGLLMWFASSTLNYRPLRLFNLIFFPGLFLIIASYWLRGQLFQRNQKIWLGRPIIQHALNLLCENLTALSNSRFRSGLFLRPSADENYVHLTFHSSNMTGALDSSIKFGKGQGCVGLVWDDPQLIVANLADPEARRGATWGLTKRQIEVTKDLQSIACVPVYKYGDVNCVVAILSVDCNNEVTTVLSSDPVKEILSEASGSLGKILAEIKLMDPLD